MKKITVVFFWFMLLQADPIDITQEFYKTINKEPRPGIKVFFDSAAHNTVFHVHSTLQDSTIAQAEYSHVSHDGFNTYHQWISSLEVAAAYQNQKHGSDVLDYILARCTGNCRGTKLHAVPADKTPQGLSLLKRFYERHGGRANGSLTHLDCYFTFPKH